MNAFERNFRRLDAMQQRHRFASFVFGVVKKYGDDNGGNLAVQLTYSMFMTVFPLLLLLLTVLSIVLADEPSLRARVVHSAFGQFPVVGQQLAHNIHTLKRSSLFGLVVGLVGLLYGTTALAQSGLHAMAEVWNVPGATRPNFVARLGRSLTFLLLLAVGLVVTTALAGFSSFGGHDPLFRVLSDAAAAVLNIGLYLGAFRVLTPRQVSTRALVPGAIFGGIGWTVLQSFGSYLVGHQLRGSSAMYGTFGLVLGLMAWIFLDAQLTLYAAEINTVRERHLWPRSLVQPPLTEADQKSLSLQATENQRRPEQVVESRFLEAPMDQDEYRARGYRTQPEGAPDTDAAETGGAAASEETVSAARASRAE